MSASKTGPLDLASAKVLLTDSISLKQAQKDSDDKAQDEASFESSCILISFHGLPVEIWGMIFAWTYHAKPNLHQAMAISHVCHHWREIAIGLTNLWTQVVINHKYAESTQQILNLLPARMGSSQRLVIYFDSSLRVFELSPRTFNYSLSPVWMRNYNSANVQVTLGQIKTLELTCSDSRRTPSIVIKPWNLRELTIQGVFLQIDPSTAQTITKLTLHYIERWISYEIDTILRNMTSLEELNLDCDAAYGDTIFQTSKPMSLRILRTQPLYILHNISRLVPLQNVYHIAPLAFENAPRMNWQSGWRNALTQYPQFVQQITYFEVILLIPVFDTSAEVAFLLLTELPNIQTLDLSGSGISVFLRVILRNQPPVRPSTLILRTTSIKGSIVLKVLRSWRDEGGTKMERVVLDCCQGITQEEVDQIKRMDIQVSIWN